jgi:hypothetical protein
MYSSNSSPNKGVDLRMITPSSGVNQQRYANLKNSSSLIKESAHSDHLEYYRIRCSDLEAYVR